LRFARYLPSALFALRALFALLFFALRCSLPAAFFVSRYFTREAQLTSITAKPNNARSATNFNNARSATNFNNARSATNFNTGEAKTFKKRLQSY
jgi:hypothetical protein